MFPREEQKGRDKMITLIWDMDGTVADLYSVENWLDYLRQYDPTPYKQAKPMWNMEKLTEVLLTLEDKGVEVKIVSWLSKVTTKVYDGEVRIAKKEWLAQYKFPCQHCHLVKYGTNKGYYRNKENLNILIDDNANVRDQFCQFDNCEAVDPTKIDIIQYLTNLADSIG